MLFIGKWNKSVILTYVGLALGVVGMVISQCLSKGVKFAFICFILAGICDLFDGVVARKCKRTDEEKAFGIQLDSLVDVANFVIFPIVLMIHIGMTRWYNMLIYFLYAICGVARLAYFNIIAEENHGEKVKYYNGLPVTASVLVFGIGYIASLWLSKGFFDIYFSILQLITAILFITNIKIKKPSGIAYYIFSAIALVVIPIYIFVI